MIGENIIKVRQIIADACEHVGRNPDEVTLIAVSKTHPPEAVLQAIEAGVQHFGENRVEEAQTKIPAVGHHTNSPPVWHMIGHLQSRKAKDAIALFDVVHSVDSQKLAEKLSKLAVDEGLNLNILLEMNVSGEGAKYGFAASGWKQDHTLKQHLWNEVAKILALPGINVHGLMTMAPIVENPEETRPVFASLASLRDELSDVFQVPLPDLSMGMTDDYPVAIEEGATLVRVGRAIFGEREK